MSDFLKTYDMVLHTLAPVYVGDGKNLNKKEYIFQKNKGRVIVPDVTRMFQGLQRKGLEKKFIEYLLADQKNASYDARMDLGRWLATNRITEKDYMGWISYEMECGDFLQDKGAIEVRTFQKDNYGLPYVPGTSIKGMLRTILLSYEIMKNPQKVGRVTQSVVENAKRGERNAKRFLNSEKNTIEQNIFYTLNRVDEKGKPVKTENAVNDCLSGLIISDSDPIALKDMVLCQKCDKNLEGGYKNLNLLRECVKPGTDISFKLTIDTRICNYTIEDIFTAIDQFSDMYYTTFLKKFPGMDRPAKGTVWLGGGTGFLTKTVVYPLLEKRQGVSTTVDILKVTLPPKIFEKHKHRLDPQKGISPHMVKCTQYRGREYQLGMCKINKK